jgi:hypothetical protein
MSAGYQVVLDDLGNAAYAFKKEATNFGNVEKQLAQQPVDTGDAALNDTLGALLEFFGKLGTSLQTSLSKHGVNLQGCHDTYKSTDDDVRALFDKVFAQASTE